jgi:predicted RNA-binding protein with PUA-like domain
VKSEPSKYSWGDFVRDGSTYWDGVRNYQARNNLRDMRVGDRVLYYHSNQGKEIVGVAVVTKRAYQDPSTDDDRWLAVDLAPLKALAEPVPLERIKADAALEKMPLVTHSRLSVMPVAAPEFKRVLKLGKTALR